jgi:hypothetical protein
VTHPGMRPHGQKLTPLALAAGLALIALTGCSTMHSWIQAGSSHPATAGASVSVPFGK